MTGGEVVSEVVIGWWCVRWMCVYEREWLVPLGRSEVKSGGEWTIDKWAGYCRPGVFGISKRSKEKRVSNVKIERVDKSGRRIEKEGEGGRFKKEKVGKCQKSTVNGRILWFSSDSESDGSSSEKREGGHTKVTRQASNHTTLRSLGWARRFFASKHRRHRHTTAPGILQTRQTPSGSGQVG